MKKRAYQLLSILFTVALLSSCSASKEAEVEDELGDFRTWVNQSTANIADRTEEDWQRAKEDFATRTRELDQKQENFSDELKQDYQNLKDEFNKADEEYERNRRAARLTEWEQKLLGTYADKTTITRDNVRQVYITFLENVRSQRSTWTNEDWEMAKLVMQSLNDRKDEVDEDLSTDDEVKIKALQMEFTTLETGGDLGGNN
ncbi:hypothetical protein H8S95_12635 [Pontibacter sp. KCTC 32443]|uniref:hypothetical protein n=1 Tax=Pontibacter TaxID=323449 RepID=UPI00164DFB46|nr:MULTISPECIES: hypothetical protein [Pontibacter]MBC5774915.1 hypothetical protein [Pontibacter sp. KCTC 32443]